MQILLEKNSRADYDKCWRQFSTGLLSSYTFCEQRQTAFILNNLFKDVYTMNSLRRYSVSLQSKGSGMCITIIKDLSSLRSGSFSYNCM